ncbi:MAG TPA: hypothetical protein VHS96_18565, partial [Bacteroidia bacterium]|nr:hypothetical protein [Bacteroidia bacterium]
MRRMLLILLLCCPFAAVQAQLSKSETKQFLRMLQAAPTFGAVMDSLGERDYALDSAAIPFVREALWQRLLDDQRRNPEPKMAFEAGKITYGDWKVGQMSVVVKGERPMDGYPVYLALHGGGGGPAEMNDEQWQQMQRYYLGSIDTGIYIAPRGPNNTWNLHFDKDAEAFYSLVLQQTRLYAGADPNRIYLLGYSAGGDGVYQLAPRMASELAAASMSAGHHNGVVPANLEHVPMLLQVGELDDAYDRNKETVRFSCALDTLAKLHPGNFVHQLYVHAGAEHSYVTDRRGPDFQANVLQDPIQWLQKPSAAKVTTAATDAPTWLKQFRRNPFPKHLRWDYYMFREGNDDYFWISYAGARLKMNGLAGYQDVEAFP